jgi:two-component system nitrate/nitrite response regulator NarL
VIDRSALFRTGVIDALSKTRFCVRAEHATLAQVPPSAFNGRYRVALVSVEAGSPEIWSRLTRLKLEHGGLRLIVLTENLNRLEMVSAIRAGASGYLLKNEITPATLLQLMDLALIGGVAISRGSTRCLKKNENDSRPLATTPQKFGDVLPINGHKLMENGIEGRLTAREREILHQLTLGATNQNIAEKLGITETIVKLHVKVLLKKLGVANRTQAAMWMMQQLKPTSADFSSEPHPPAAAARARESPTFDRSTRGI